MEGRVNIAFQPFFRPSTPLYENEYTVLFNKTPPPNYSAWLSFADSRGCPIHPKYYTQIQRDFEPWRDGIHNTAHILKDALDEYNATQIGHFRGGKFDLGPREIMDAVEPIMPKEKEFRYL
ncbi:hypothetical protein BCR33DRAFT_450579 [Rhizoclosmatium globosum]|uniref:Uncharacterized protein n=1 Tax=Rhizoclosmatium globosum TaxID=329046 RepID=A0A1Y2CW31_9FUNG|nr:hypothetical protein BCR33DRAFT_450579 [Rhizoclosmatium globosum]|eukprot:ORY51249.1 hypothetical protein BCR33DRAFT_450579 [Rhizoclosmatium globosum]